MKMKSLLSILFIALSLSLTSCASKKKANDTDPLAVSDDANNSGLSLNAGDLQLNGDSDTNRAGALKTVYFDYSSANITGMTKETLDSNAQFLKTNTNVKIQVEGHCDERGSVQFNLALGEKRAQSVRDYLVAQGIESGRITIISLGKEKPMAFGHDEEAWSQNRRANFVVTGK